MRERGRGRRGGRGGREESVLGHEEGGVREEGRRGWYLGVGPRPCAISEGARPRPRSTAAPSGGGIVVGTHLHHMT